MERTKSVLAITRASARTLRSFLAFAIILNVPEEAFSQVERATITGVLRDKANANIDQAIVKVVDEGTNQTTAVKTDAAGAYTANSLASGNYYFVPPGAPNPHYQWNDFGGRLGGPSSGTGRSSS